MYGNRVKKKLAAGDIAIALGGHSVSGDTIDFCGPLGFDGYWIEGEHGPVTWDRIGDLSRACDLWNMASIMRIHSHEAGVITRVLDLGVSGIVVPHVNTKAQAQHVADSARFAPLGKRGMYSGRRAYGSSDFFERANDEILVVVLIEEVEAVENLDEILTVDQIDVFFVAPSDLAQSMGHVGQPYHPEVQKVVESTLERIAAAGRIPGAMGIEDRVKGYMKRGARFFLTSYNTWIADRAKQYLETVNSSKGNIS